MLKDMTHCIFVCGLYLIVSRSLCVLRRSVPNPYNKPSGFLDLFLRTGLSCGVREGMSLPSPVRGSVTPTPPLKRGGVIIRGHLRYTPDYLPGVFRLRLYNTRVSLLYRRLSIPYLLVSCKGEVLQTSYPGPH